jgi:hypothetical protein
MGLVPAPRRTFQQGLHRRLLDSSKETAEEYRQSAARRSSNADTCIIQIQIPQSFIRSLRIQHLWYSPNWKEYVWTCRKMERPNQKSTVSGDLGNSTLQRPHLLYHEQ